MLIAILRTNSLFYFFSRYFIVPTLLQAATIIGVDIRDVEYNAVSVPNWKTYNWHLASGAATWNHPMNKFYRLIVQGRLTTASVHFSQVFSPNCSLELLGLDLYFDEKQAKEVFQGKEKLAQIVPKSSIRFDYLRFGLELHWWSLFDDLEQEFTWLLKNLLDGNTPAGFEAQGKIFTEIKGEPVQIGFTMKEVDGQKKLVLNRNDLRSASRFYGEKLTEEEIATVAEFPFRAEQLLRIKAKAEVTANRAHFAEPSVPEDAFRHVLWSFLIARRYNSEFSQKVTDAHEGEGASDNDTPLDHLMDLNNNSVGRAYAAAGIEEFEILPTLLYDPRVIFRRPLPLAYIDKLEQREAQRVAAELKKEAGKQEPLKSEQDIPLVEKIGRILDGKDKAAKKKKLPRPRKVGQPLRMGE